MKINYVTCSGANEHTDIKGLIKLMSMYRFAEVGIQVSAEKCAFDSERMRWIRTLDSELRCKYAKSTDKKKKERRYKFCINAALHVNSQWAEDFGQGIVDHELLYLLGMRNLEGDPFFQRVQLNIRVGREKAPDEYKLLDLMQMYKSHRFILVYNKDNDAFIRKMYALCSEVGLQFDLLYDESHGEGIEPAERPAPLFIDVNQGYAGGIGPLNVYNVLNEIFSAQCSKPFLGGISIDAEGKLKNDRNRFDLRRCQLYLDYVEEWLSDYFEGLSGNV